MHLTPAGFPFSMPGIGEEIETAIQQAPQSGLHSIGDVLCNMYYGLYAFNRVNLIIIIGLTAIRKSSEILCIFTETGIG
jgi:hypothetical protein